MPSGERLHARRCTTWSTPTSGFWAPCSITVRSPFRNASTRKSRLSILTTKMFENLREDLNRAMRETRSDPNWKPSLGKRLEVMVRHSTWPVVAYRFSRWARSVRIPVIGLLLRIVGLFFRKFVEVFTSVHIDVRADIGPGFVIHSVYAINLGATKIGKNFTIATGCLISHAYGCIGDDGSFRAAANSVDDSTIVI